MRWAALLLCGCQATTTSMVVTTPALPAVSAAHHDIPKQCASGCDVSPVSAPPEDAEFRAAFDEVASLPVGAKSDGLDFVLFYASVARAELAYAKMSAAHRVWLSRELSRDRARIAMRIVDEEGVVRAHFDDVTVPLAEKQHLGLDDERLPGLVASGTVVRVSQERLWTRI